MLAEAHNQDVPYREGLEFLARLWLYPFAPLTPRETQALQILAEAFSLEYPQEEEPLEVLQEEYTRLFINAPEGIPAAPYASVYLSKEGLLCQEPWEEALRFYREAGFAPKGQEPADHLAYELAFVGLMLQEGQNDLLNQFLCNHLLVWFPFFKETLLQADPPEFYVFLASLTEALLSKISEEVCS